MSPYEQRNVEESSQTFRRSRRETCDYVPRTASRTSGLYRSYRLFTSSSQSRVVLPVWFGSGLKNRDSQSGFTPSPGVRV